MDPAIRVIVWLMGAVGLAIGAGLAIAGWFIHPAVGVVGVIAAYLWVFFLSALLGW